MNKEFKTVLVMNLMYNLFLALILSAVAQFMSMGGIQFPAIIGDILIAYVLEMVIALGLPFSKWGMALGEKYAEPGSLKYRCLMTTGTAVPFAFAMCLCMSFIGSVLIAHLPLSVWFSAFLSMLPVFIVLGWVLSFFCVPFFMGLSHKIVFKD